MSVTIGGTTPQLTFADATVQNTAALPLTGGSVSADITVHGLTVGQGGGSVSTNTAVGASALNASASGTNNSGFGSTALYNLTLGSNNTGLGSQALYTNTSGTSNTGVGQAALYGNNGSANTAIGFQSLAFNSSASNNTAMGYQAGYSASTQSYNTFVGAQAGYLHNTGGTIGAYNCFVGFQAGYNVTTGIKNTIIGGYNGNQGSLDIRTSNNYIVLSDGDGNPRFGYSGIYGWVGTDPQVASGSQATLAITGVGSGGGVAGTRNALWLRNSSASGNQSNFLIFGSAGTSSSIIFGNDLPANGTAVSTLLIQAGNSGGVNLTSGATSWVSASDARLKNVTGKYDNALADISQLEPVKFTWKSDAENKPQVGVLAQSVQSVVPEAIDHICVDKEDKTDYLGVRYTELIPLLVASIQQLSAQVTALQAKVGV
jgi:hypothetical protein